MERNEQRSDLIDLGAASVETKGLVGHIPDFAKGQDGTVLKDD